MLPCWLSLSLVTRPAYPDTEVDIRQFLSGRTKKWTRLTTKGT